MSENKRYIILFLAFFFLLKVFSCSIVPENDADNDMRCKPVRDEVTITESEVDDFLKLWKEYVLNEYDTKVSDKISLMDGTLEENLPISVKLWFKANCWTAKRFYHVEDRLRAALRTLYLKRHTASILDILKERTNGTNSVEYKNMADMQNKIANIENITEDELKLVQMREKQISDVLN